MWQAKIGWSNGMWWCWISCSGSYSQRQKRVFHPPLNTHRLAWAKCLCLCLFFFVLFLRGLLMFIVFYFFLFEVSDYSFVIVPFRQYSSSEFPSFYPPPLLLRYIEIHPPPDWQRDGGGGGGPPRLTPGPGCCIQTQGFLRGLDGSPREETGFRAEWGEWGWSSLFSSPFSTYFQFNLTSPPPPPRLVISTFTPI